MIPKNNGLVDEFLKLFNAFTKVPKQKLLRSIDHSIVVLIVLSMLPSAITTSEQYALQNPKDATYENAKNFGIVLVFFFVGMTVCELLVGKMINPFRNH